MKYKPFNINHNVKVKLTRVGVQRYKDWMNRYVPVKDSSPKIDENGYTEFQMWTFMQIYGDTMYMGNVNPCIGTEILIEFKEDAE